MALRPPVEAPPAPLRPRSARRLVLSAAVAGLAGLVARRAHANASPSELEVGGSTGAETAHLSCGPDVRVAHASGGMHYERVFPAEDGPDGRGLLMDVRAGVGATTITSVTPPDGAEASVVTQAGNLEKYELGRHHVLATAQASFGFDWYSFAMTGGVGYFGLSEMVDGVHFRARYLPLPALDMRVGKRVGLSGNFGVGAPPVAGLARWYSAYGLAQYRFREGGEVGVGLTATFGGELDQRAGVLFKGTVPVTRWLSVGGFGLVGGDDQSKPSSLGWTAGASASFKIDEP